MRTFTFRPFLNHIAIYPLELYLRDNRYKPLFKPFKFNLQVVPPILEKANMCPLSLKLEKCHPRILDISSKGLLQIGFPIEIKIINETNYTNASTGLEFKLRRTIIDEIPRKIDCSIISWSIVRFTGK